MEKRITTRKKSITDLNLFDNMNIDMDLGLDLTRGDTHIFFGIMENETILKKYKHSNRAKYWKLYGKLLEWVKQIPDS